MTGEVLDMFECPLHCRWGEHRNWCGKPPVAILYEKGNNGVTFTVCARHRAVGESTTGYRKIWPLDELATQDYCRCEEDDGRRRPRTDPTPQPPPSQPETQTSRPGRPFPQRPSVWLAPPSMASHRNAPPFGFTNNDLPAKER